MGNLYFFQYDKQAVEYLKSRDQVLGQAIDIIGPIQRRVEPDLFMSLINSIISQQISAKAVTTIWNRLLNTIGEIKPQTINNCSVEAIQSCGLSFRKASYIKNVTECVLKGDLDIDNIKNLRDEQVCAELSKLNGIGVWTAEMLLIFSLQRQDVLSYGDLAIHRGLRMLYHHRKITKALFAKYRKRYSPYNSVASLYIWAIAGGAIPHMRDYALKSLNKKK